MANIALDSAASGLSALNTKLDVIANNLANSNTTGFKASRANFEDLLYIERKQPGIESSSGDRKPTGLYVGLGVQVSGTSVNFEQGSPVQTGRELDVMIQGQGFFQVEVEDALGGTAYTRAGNFEVNADGELVLATDIGRRLTPTITVPDDASSITIAADGTVSVTQPGSADITEVGRLELARFVNPPGLKQIGENLFAETAASGPPNLGEPQEDGFGSLRQGMLESSNVDPATELVELIRTQRAFEFNSTTIRAADETLRTVSQLRR